MIKTIKYKGYKFDINVETHPAFDNYLVEIYSIGDYAYKRHTSSTEESLEKDILDLEQNAKNHVDKLLNKHSINNVKDLLIKLGFEEL